jgi:hypothetical protein
MIILIIFSFCKYPHHLIARSRLAGVANQCPLSGVKRTSRLETFMSAFDPKRTYKSDHKTKKPLTDNAGGFPLREKIINLYNSFGDPRAGTISV